MAQGKLQRNLISISFKTSTNKANVNKRLQTSNIIDGVYQKESPLFSRQFFTFKHKKKVSEVKNLEKISVTENAKFCPFTATLIHVPVKQNY